MEDQTNVKSSTQMIAQTLRYRFLVVAVEQRHTEWVVLTENSRVLSGWPLAMGIPTPALTRVCRWSMFSNARGAMW